MLRLQCDQIGPFIDTLATLLKLAASYFGPNCWAIFEMWSKYFIFLVIAALAIFRQLSYRHWATFSSNLLVTLSGLSFITFQVRDRVFDSGRVQEG